MKNLFMIIVLLSSFTISAFAGSGGITGKLTYPSDYIPPTMILCVQKSGGKTYCSNYPERVSRYW